MNRLKQIREKKGMSQNRLATLARCSQPMIVALEAPPGNPNYRVPSQKLALRINRVLKCEVFTSENTGSK